MGSDPISLELTLELARQAQRVHGPKAGACAHCRVPWPCAAAERVEDTITVLTGKSARAVGRVEVHPRWTIGIDHPG